VAGRTEKWLAAPPPPSPVGQRQKQHGCRRHALMHGQGTAAHQMTRTGQSISPATQLAPSRRRTVSRRRLKIAAHKFPRPVADTEGLPIDSLSAAVKAKAWWLRERSLAQGAGRPKNESMRRNGDKRASHRGDT